MGESMKYQRKFPIVLVLGCLCLMLVTVPAYGYADPNTVGMISQILTPLLITAGACATFLRKSLAVAWSRLWRRLRGGTDA
jgi:hypothetical protein